jgi:thymidine kinase
MSELNVVIGPMYSGKSSYLIRKINNSILNKEHIIVINHISDTRYNQNKITNHNNISTDAVLLTNLKNIYIYIKNNSINLEDIDHIYIDEAQFFTDLEEVVSELINKSTNFKNNKLKITCVGLDGDFQQTVFNEGQLLKLISKATTVTKLFSKCYKCGKQAPFTSRLIDKTDQILIGSKDVYVASCYIHKINLVY